MIFLLLATYPISTSTITSSFSEKKYIYQRFRKHFFFFHFICVVVKMKIFDWFSPYPVTATMIWPTTDRIPHSLIFKRMQIKWIVDNWFVHSLLYWQIGTKNLTRREFIVEASFFTSWTIRSEKCARAHVQQNKTMYLSIYLSLWKPFWKRVYIYIHPFLKRFSYREIYR